MPTPGQKAAATRKRRRAGAKAALTRRRRAAGRKAAATRKRRGVARKAAGSAEPMRRICTFAYGSNMLTARLRERVSSAAAVGIGRLPGHVLKWHKRSRDGSGKCDIESTGLNEEVVWVYSSNWILQKNRRLIVLKALTMGTPNGNWTSLLTAAP